MTSMIPCIWISSDMSPPLRSSPFTRHNPAEGATLSRSHQGRLSPPPPPQDVLNPHRPASSLGSPDTSSRGDTSLSRNSVPARSLEVLRPALQQSQSIWARQFDVPRIFPAPELQGVYRKPSIST